MILLSRQPAEPGQRFEFATLVVVETGVVYEYVQESPVWREAHPDFKEHKTALAVYGPGGQGPHYTIEGEAAVRNFAVMAAMASYTAE